MNALEVDIAKLPITEYARCRPSVPEIRAKQLACWPSRCESLVKIGMMLVASHPVRDRRGEILLEARRKRWQRLESCEERGVLACTWPSLSPSPRSAADRVPFCVRR